MRHWGRATAAALGIGGAALLAVSWHTAREQAFPAPQAVGPPPRDFPGGLEDARLHTADGLELRGWYGAGEPGRGAIVLLHPYDGTRRSMLAHARLFREGGYGVLLYDARASGESEGQRRSLGFHETADLLAALEYLTARGVAAVACVGWSQGGSTLLMAAEQLPPQVRCVVLESAFDTLEHSIDRAFRKRVGLPGWLAGVFYRPLLEHFLGLRCEDFRPLDHAAQLRCPVLVLGGTEDRSTWPADTQALYDATAEPRELWLVPGAAHEDLYRHAPEEYSRRVLGFLRRWMP